jgi:hypothetical protein
MREWEKKHRFFAFANKLTMCGTLVVVSILQKVTARKVHANFVVKTQITPLSTALGNSTHISSYPLYITLLP